MASRLSLSKSALPEESTAAAKSACPEEFTTLNCSFNTKLPFLVKMSVSPSADFSGKKPSPEIARSKVLEENSTLPWLNSWRTSFSDTPCPTTDVDFCKGEVAKMSPNEALDFLNPLVPTLAMLLLVNASSVVAAFSPVSEV